MATSETNRYIIRNAGESSVKQHLVETLKSQIEQNKIDLARDNWGIYGSSIESYETQFRDVMDSVKITDLIRRKTSPVAIDLMSPSDTLANIFERISPTKPRFGLALSYKDKRDDFRREKDKMLGIEQIYGDILEATTWEKIEKTLAGRKADLIMERARAGNDHITHDVRIHAILLNNAWNLLNNDHSMLLVELPIYKNGPLLPGTEITLSDWVFLLKEEGIGVNLNWRTLKLVKTSNSPKNLPFLK